MSFLCDLFGPKYQRKNLKISALESEKWSNQKIKVLHNVFDTLNSPYKSRKIIVLCIIKCLYFVDLTTFQILGQKFAKFFLVFWSKRWHQKDILKSTDLCLSTNHNAALKCGAVLWLVEREAEFWKFCHHIVGLYDSPREKKEDVLGF